MYKRQIRSMLKSTIEYPGEIATADFSCLNDPTQYESWYLGSFMYIDPCGKYHHIISPNEITLKCQTFWDELESIAENEFNGWIESGEGDPTDIFFCKAIDN